MNSSLCCTSSTPPFSFSLSLNHCPHTPTPAHTHVLPPCVQQAILSSGVRWVGGSVGGRWGCGVERAGIHSNMHREITIAPLGDLQMLLVGRTVEGSYRSANMSWETTKQHMHPTDLLSLFLSAAFHVFLCLPFSYPSLFKKFDTVLLPNLAAALRKDAFPDRGSSLLARGGVLDHAR